MINPKFNVGDVVVINSTGRTAKIIHRRLDEIDTKGKITEQYTYGLSTSPYYNMTFYKENEISFYDKFDDKFESGFAKLMLDANLLINNIHMAKVYDQIKKDFSEGESNDKRK